MTLLRKRSAAFRVSSDQARLNGLRLIRPHRGRIAVTTTTNQQRREYVTRDRILKLPSDDEVASVTTAETAAHLSDGDEYLDLEQLNQGVRGHPSQPRQRGACFQERL